jgi:TonB family protein
MSLGTEKIPEPIASENLGSLSGCLVDGDVEQRQRERCVRRRALAISIVLQTAALTVLVLVPLFAKTERIVMKGFVPMPPYGRPSSPAHGSPKPNNGRQAIQGRDFVFHPPTRNPRRPFPPDEDLLGPEGIDPAGNQPPNGPGCNGCVDIGINPTGPRLPQPPEESHKRPEVLHFTSIAPAMLIHRVEPVYPPLAKQIHKEGRVELRAIIGTGGTIQSLQVVSGDPLFLMSAREAVQQWKYKPTYLNGQAVEIDTYITVIYTTQH